MFAGAARHNQIAPCASTASAVSALFVEHFASDRQRVATPRPEIHIAVRFGPSARGGIDVAALGVRPKAHRKLIRAGHSALMARLRLGAHIAVLGVPACALSGRIVPLEELWGQTAAHLLCEQLASARTMVEAAAFLESAIAERLRSPNKGSDRSRLALDSAALLASASANVTAVASELGVSERHLRRVFRETVGVSPKTFSRLVRFQYALRAARENGHRSWADIAAESGYYDQAHLIAEFRELTGVTPKALLDELRGQASLGELCSAVSSPEVVHSRVATGVHQ